jgi:hypothetical protein
MKPTDAVVMDNWFPGEDGCSIRPGYEPQSTGLGATVETLMAYESTTATKLFGFAGTTMWDCTTSGAAATAVVTGLTNAQWQYTLFTNSSGTWLIAVNGTDTPIVFNGTYYFRPGSGVGAAVSSITRAASTATVTTSTPHGLVTGNIITMTGATQPEYNITATITVTGGSTFTYTVTGAPATPATGAPTYTYTPSFTGVLLSDLITVTTHARRLWAVKKNSMEVWYGATDAVSGTLTKFDLGPVFQLGGYLMHMISWGVAGDTNAKGYAAFITSEGEIAIYEGDDPSSASTWGLKGVYRTGKPIGRKCWIKFGGDVLIMTDDGVFPLSQVILNNRAADTIATTRRISALYNQSLYEYRTTYGWEMCFFPLGSKLFVNVPTGTGFGQYVMNTNTGAWCTYSGLQASSWTTWDDNVVFGASDGTVYLAETGEDDDGDSITTDVVTSFQNFGASRQKRFTMARPTFVTEATFTPALGMMFDYSVTDPISYPSMTSRSSGTAWGSPWSSPWGATSFVAVANWQHVGGIGFTAAMRLKTNTKGFSVKWAATDFVYEPGGVL